MFFMSLNAMRMLNASKFVYTLAGAVPAFNSANAGRTQLQENIQAGFHFWCELLTISFTTVNSAGVDDGVCTLSAQFRDGANQVGLSNTFVDLSLLSAPGRQRTVGLAGDPSNQLDTPGIPWPYLYLETGGIIADISNISNTANDVKMAFNGYLIPRDKMAQFDAWLNSQASMTL